MKKYSIIVPIWNGGHYLKECVASVLAQSYPHFDLILLESCSTDGTADWLKALTDDRIQIYYSNRPLTITENWSRILEVPLNEFVTITGQDDILGANYLEEMNTLIEKHPTASLYQTHFDFIDKNSKHLKMCLPMDERQQAHELLSCLCTNTIDSMATGYLFRANDYTILGGISIAYPDLLFADNELWINLTAKSYKATSFQNCFSYRVHQSLSKTTAGTQYYRSFTEYIVFLKKRCNTDALMKDVLTRYGKEWLYRFCEAVAHRLLKTPFEKRTIRVSELVEECRKYAEWMIPGQAFHPLSKKRIRLAVTIDKYTFTRTVFQAFRKIYAKPL